MEEADAILWGATGGPETKEVPAAARKAGSLLGLRSKYDLYANLRPIVANPALADELVTARAAPGTLDAKAESALLILPSSPAAAMSGRGSRSRASR